MACLHNCWHRRDRSDPQVLWQPLERELNEEADCERQTKAESVTPLDAKQHEAPSQRKAESDSS